MQLVEVKIEEVMKIFRDFKSDQMTKQAMWCLGCCENYGSESCYVV